ncbi:cell wall-binding repeat-containing protein [Intrasporangium calvum]|uniref:Cell wall-binding repeat-containing protein n=1 Tax=Intrasporangium calvum TaxID=53358 RepID=A0ABT5GLG7_9MICO|nr:cell wall-binding repeat-containing protein [Intrasporangium calvum]MDC5698934.1 cell wall-binding repeat-containing protein [Intrasporangium calvum]
MTSQSAASRRFTRPKKLVAGAAALTLLTLGGVQGASAADPGVDIVYVATGANFPDALAGSVLAALEGAPILLVTRDSIPTATGAELARLDPRYIRVLGGASVVSDAVLTQLKSYATANTADEVTRIAGSNRYETAAEISKRVPAAASKLPDNQVKVVTGSPALPSSLGVLASTTVTLPDVCPGPDSWKVRATVNGYYLTSGSVTSGAATTALSLDDPASYLSATITNQNFVLNVGQTRENYISDYIFDGVDAGNHTIRQWGLEDTNVGVTAAQNRLLVEVLGYTC